MPMSFRLKKAKRRGECRVEREVKVSASARIDGDGYQMDSQDDSPPDDFCSKGHIPPEEKVVVK